MATIFSQIIRGEIPCYKIYEDDFYLAFLDIMPLTMGHTLVIPKREESYIFNLHEDELSGLMQVSQKVARAVEKAVPCKRIGVAVIGLEVPHTHIHLVPINQVGDINFEKEKMRPTQAELAEMASRICAFLK
jgi:histidine triad (HIT) family protein